MIQKIISEPVNIIGRRDRSSIFVQLSDPTLPLVYHHVVTAQYEAHLDFNTLDHKCRKYAYDLACVECNMRALSIPLTPLGRIIRKKHYATTYFAGRVRKEITLTFKTGISYKMFDHTMIRKIIFKKIAELLTDVIYDIQYDHKLCVAIACFKDIMTDPIHILLFNSITDEGKHNMAAREIINHIFVK